jgi:general secretion pathway protein N
MALKRGSLAGALLALLVVGLVALFWWLPARLALPLVEARLKGVHAAEVSGSVWNGEAGMLTDAHGKALGRLNWTLSRTAVFGHHQLAFDFSGPVGSAGGEMDAQHGQSTWRHVRADLAMDRLSVSGGLREQAPQGRLLATFDTIDVQGNWPQALQGTVRWRDASLIAQGQRAPLGDFRADLTGAAGVIHGTIADEGDGPLTAKGSLLLAPLGWRLDLLLTPRHADAGLARVLSRWARPAADGSFHIVQRTGLVPAETP